MQLKLNCYLLKIEYYNCKRFYMSLMETTKQKPTADNEKGIKAYNFRKSPFHRGRQEKETKELQSIQIMKKCH